jgi:hypothetical protein
MRSRYLAAKIAFLVVALFTVSYQCAAQCLVNPCHELGTKVPPCHRSNSRSSEAPEVCKAPLFLAAELRIQSSNHPEPSTGMLLSFVTPDLVTEKAGLLLSPHCWRPPQPPFPAEIRLTTPLRI